MFNKVWSLLVSFSLADLGTQITYSVIQAVKKVDVADRRYSSTLLRVITICLGNTCFTDSPT